MGNFLLAAFLLCVGGSILRTVEPLEFKFGDLIRFHPEEGLSGPSLHADHYGVALGRNDTKGRELYFHKVSTDEHTGHCEVWYLSSSSKDRRRLDNYQDRGHNLTETEEQGVRKRLEECMAFKPGVLTKNCCGFLDLISNNCEHTATYIRYGSKGRFSCLVATKTLSKKLYPKQCKDFEKEFEKLE